MTNRALSSTLAPLVSVVAIASCAAEPTEVVRPVVAWARVSAGAAHTCGLGTDGALYCWGSNRHAQLGASIKDLVTTVPTRVSGSSPYTDVSAGSQHTCAVAGGRTAYCWGSDDAGQLGIGRERDEQCTRGSQVFRCRTSADAVAGDLALASVAAGAFHTCALTVDGAAYCWGLNGSGQLGARTSGETCGGLRQPCRATPVAVSGDLRFESVTAGFAHTCALTADGTAYCWGDNGLGELGAPASEECTIGSAARPCSFEPVRVSDQLTFVAISAGRWHTCALRAEGRAYCWGSNQFGALGATVEAESCALGPCVPPTPVEGDLVFAELSGANFFTCAITTGGTAYCWGSGEQGQLGTGSIENTAGPVRVLGDVKFTRISGGQAHTCAVAEDDSAYCWGDNASGQLGIPNSAGTQGPARVPGG